MLRPWDGIGDEMEVARMRMRGLFELTEKLSMPFFCFHDRDIAPEGASLRESNRNLDEIVKLAKQLMASSPTRLLWATSNLFHHPRYMHGAATSPEPKVFAYAAAQVKKTLEVAKELGGENFVFWGGREGYETLLNTDFKRELDNMARFLRLALDYAKEIGFTGQFLIEPKLKNGGLHRGALTSTRSRAAAAIGARTSRWRTSPAWTAWPVATPPQPGCSPTAPWTSPWPSATRAGSQASTWPRGTRSTWRRW